MLLSNAQATVVNSNILLINGMEITRIRVSVQRDLGNFCQVVKHLILTYLYFVDSLKSIRPFHRIDSCPNHIFLLFIQMTEDFVLNDGMKEILQLVFAVVPLLLMAKKKAKAKAKAGCGSGSGSSGSDSDNTSGISGGSKVDNESGGGGGGGGGGQLGRGGGGVDNNAEGAANDGVSGRKAQMIYKWLITNGADFLHRIRDSKKEKENTEIERNFLASLETTFDVLEDQHGQVRVRS